MELSNVDAGSPPRSICIDLVPEHGPEATELMGMCPIIPWGHVNM